MMRQRKPNESGSFPRCRTVNFTFLDLLLKSNFDQKTATNGAPAVVIAMHIAVMSYDANGDGHNGFILAATTTITIQ